MAYLPGFRGQPSPSDDLLDFSGTVAVAGTPQLVIPQQPGRSYLLLQNIFATAIFVTIGPAKVTATLTSGKVTGFTIVNAGLGYTVAPKVRLLGGTIVGNMQISQEQQFNFKGAKAVATISGGAVNSVSVDGDGGANYQVAPTVYLDNPGPDLGGGVLIPSATFGVELLTHDALIFDGSFCPTSAVAVFGAAGSEKFTCLVGF